MIALSLLAIAIGAILRFAISATLTGIDIPTVGVILMVLGVVGLIIGLGLLISGRGSSDRSAGP